MGLTSRLYSVASFNVILSQNYSGIPSIPLHLSHTDKSNNDRTANSGHPSIPPYLSHTGMS